MSVVTVPLLHVASATPRSRLLTIDISQVAFDFLAGQAVLVGQHGQDDRRPYSIACSPERAAQAGQLELLIALESNGTLGPHLPMTRPGTLVDIEGPLGTFVFPDDPGQPHLMFVAGGTGISPLRAMMDHALRRHASHDVSLLYSARRGDEFAFIDELLAYAKAGRITLHQTVTRDDSDGWAGKRGRIGRAHFESLVPDPRKTLCFVCGPRAMVAESIATLQAIGVPDAAIRTEGWAVPPS